jgi:hypothetical protein
VTQGFLSLSIRAEDAIATSVYQEQSVFIFTCPSVMDETTTSENVEFIAISSSVDGVSGVYILIVLF